MLPKGVNIRTGTDTYSAETAQSDFAFSQPKDTSYELKGNLGLGGFNYLGDGVAVEEINGNLTKAIFRRIPKGDYSLTTALRGNSLVLKLGDFSITSLVGFGADSINLKIPVKGGYEIKGNVDAKDVSRKLLERDIRNVSGTLETLISGPRKRFGAKNLQGTLAEQSVALTCDFQMNAARYVASPFNIKGCGGNIQGTLSLERTQDALIRTKSEAADLELACLEAIWQTPKGDQVKGVLKKLSLDASGSKTALPQTLKGGGSIVIQDGIIREIGVDAAFAKMLRGVPIIGSQIPLEPGTSKNDELSRTRAEAKKLEADLVFENGRIKTDNLKVGGRLGNIEAKGSYEFGKELDLTGSVIFFENTARLIAGLLRLLQGLFGELGKVELPFRITGPLSSPLVRGSVGELLQTSAPTRFVGGVVSGAGNVVSGVGGLLFGRKATPTPEATPGPQ